LNKRNKTISPGRFLCWLAAFITIAACAGILIYIIANGYKQISLKFLFTQPAPAFDESQAGGISTPVIGTILVTVVGTLIAFPWALSTAIFLAEYGGNKITTKYIRLGVEVLAGVPTIVIAIFGLAVFTNPVFGFLSSIVETDSDIKKAFGRSFFVCGITMAIMVLPFMIKVCEEAIKCVPDSYREGSLALGASKWHTITHIILPSSKNGIATGVILGMGRIIGDTAIVWLTLGGTMRMTGIQPWWKPANWLSTLTHTGSTLTSYIYFASPAGEGNMPLKAFGASFVLIIIILILNFIVDYLSTLGKQVGRDNI